MERPKKGRAQKKSKELRRKKRQPYAENPTLGGCEGTLLSSGDGGRGNRRVEGNVPLEQKGRKIQVNKTRPDICEMVKRVKMKKEGRNSGEEAFLISIDEKGNRKS